VLFQRFHHALEVWITCAEAAGEPVSAALSDRLTIGDNVELTGASRLEHGVDV